MAVQIHGPFHQIFLVAESYLRHRFIYVACKSEANLKLAFCGSGTKSREKEPWVRVSTLLTEIRGNEKASSN
jgi:hypothetical protein